MIFQHQKSDTVTVRGGIPRWFFLLFMLFVSVSMDLALDEKGGTAGAQSDVHFRAIVYDADIRTPIELARVVLRRDRAVIAEKVTNPSGVALFVDISPGRYKLSVHFVGYNDFFDSIFVDDQHEIDSVGLHVISQTTVEVVGERALGVASFDLSSGNQVFESETYHVAPTARMTSLVQQSLMGAARAPTGEVHIRGQHGEFTYYIDGNPVPLGVFGGLNEVVDPKVTDRAIFYTGGFPAEYGGQIAAIVDVQNRVPAGRLHLDASIYGGSYLVPNTGDSLGERVGSFRAMNSNGQSLSLSSHLDKLGFFFSGSRQETDRRIDPPVASLFHDHGFDYFLYGKFDYTLSDVDFITANINYGKTNTQVPYDSLEQIMDDVQITTNSFQTLSYYRTLSSEKNKESNLFVGGYAREGGLVYTPGAIDPPGFQFAGDTSNMYILAEDRSFTTFGTRMKYDSRLMHQLMVAVGLNFSSTSGIEDFTSRDAVGSSGPSVTTNFKGSDFGAFAEGELHPLEWTTFEVGVRYDQHIAPDAPLQDQVSPRVRWNIAFDESNSGYLYYGKLFMPNNIEGLRTLASNVSTSEMPTLPERDDFYEAVYMHEYGFGLRSKLAGFYKHASPGVDDQTVGSSAIKTPVNIQTVRTAGVELGFSFSDPLTPFSGYLNTSLIHAYGSGLITGGFLTIDDAGDATDLDHDQRLSVVGSLNYQPKNWFANLTAIYGSGLTNGNPDGVPYKTGLFDFNVATHTSSSWILNLSAGYTVPFDGGMTLEPSFYVTNLLDHDHLIKGAFFSGASYEERRNVVFKLAMHM
jgi:hypothetical protein